MPVDRAWHLLVRRYLHQGESLIVVHDDIDLPVGKIKLKRQGGDAGHLGIRSIIAWLGSDVFVRIRMGIGKPPRKRRGRGLRPVTLSGAGRGGPSDDDRPGCHLG